MPDQHEGDWSGTTESRVDCFLVIVVAKKVG